MLCVNFNSNWSNGAGEKVFLKKSCQFILTLQFPHNLTSVLHLNKLESPTPKTALCDVCFELGPVVVEKKCFKAGQFIFTILNLSPLRRKHGCSFEQT